jgi:hypothetical protein
MKTATTLREEIVELKREIAAMHHEHREMHAKGDRGGADYAWTMLQRADKKLVEAEAELTELR